MVKESSRKCSRCGNNGHNSRTCNGSGTGGVKLFGVDISENKVQESIKRSFSLGNPKPCDEEHNSNVRNADGNVAGDESGYLSDGLIHNKKHKDAHERKKGLQWTEEEHKTFLVGLKVLGRGNWREIAKRFVTTRTPTQVASHAQKYFLRKYSNNKKKRRSSLFDMRFEHNDSDSNKSRASIAMRGQEILSQGRASISQTLPAETAGESHYQINAAELVNQFPHLCLDISSAATPIGDAAGGVPNYHAIPCLVGDPPKVVFVPVVSFGNQNKSTRNTSATSVNGDQYNFHKSSNPGEWKKDELLKIEQPPRPDIYPKALASYN